tara:strand:+ start:786 stop:1307 length:522 start_codon:yes stop_codon:yes gene_type:complete
MIDIINTKIDELKIIKPKIYNDNRGYFFESYNQKIFHDKIGKVDFVQDNESKSSFGVLRGLHYQEAPYEQSKLIRVIKGNIQDIAVDLRVNSPTYLKYVSVILNDENKKQFFVPKGFAHGFLVLSNHAIVNYKVDCFYNKKYEKVIPYNNIDIDIDWKLDNQDILLSDKDRDF